MGLLATATRIQYTYCLILGAGVSTLTDVLKPKCFYDHFVHWVPVVSINSLCTKNQVLTWHFATLHKESDVNVTTFHREDQVLMWSLHTND
jgi:hypothetical protein